jgi:SAM-dependent methyltransferase
MSLDIDMGPRDPHRFVNELDDATVGRLIARLETRAKDAVFNRPFDNYVTRLDLAPAARVLEVGCGTGAMLRALTRRSGFVGAAVGLDQSAAFIDAARGFAEAEGAGDRLTFQVGDAHALPFESGVFDAVIAHTLISHVTEPAVVLKELARVVRGGGSVAIFDGDYASLTYAYPDHEFGRRMDAALAAATFSNPFVLRRLPGWLPGIGLRLQEALPDVVAEIGSGSYFKSFAETYAPFVIRAGLVASADVDAWLAVQLKSIDAGTFFASCNYYAFLATRE